MRKFKGFAHPIPKGKISLEMLHIDHLGPFTKSKRGKFHQIVAVDAFTKFTFFKAVRSTINTSEVCH